MTTTLYRFYNTDGQLLYVGIAGNPARRFEQHAHEKSWWDDVRRVTVNHFYTREEAAAAEREAITHEQPLHNVVHNSRLSSAAKEAKRKGAVFGKVGRFWPDAESIEGTGRYAVVAKCRVTTVKLHKTEAEAAQTFNNIEREACGGMCVRAHEIWMIGDSSGFQLGSVMREVRHGILRSGRRLHTADDPYGPWSTYPDYCAQCGDRMRHYDPDTMWLRDTGGLQAEYTCLEGHTWFTSWSAQ